MLIAFLAHLSRSLIGELIVNRPSSVGINNFKHFLQIRLPDQAKFYNEPPWVGGTKVRSRHLGHMTKMAAKPRPYMVKPFKNLLQNRKSDFHETWYVASGTPAHHSLFK